MLEFDDFEFGVAAVVPDLVAFSLERFGENVAGNEEDVASERRCGGATAGGVVVDGEADESVLWGGDVSYEASVQVGLAVDLGDELYMLGAIRAGNTRTGVVFIEPVVTEVQTHVEDVTGVVADTKLD